MSAVESLGYRSPVCKLLRFFRRSRDQWKEKCKTAKRENKSLKTRLAKTRESRDRWKTEARELREQQVATTAPPGQAQKSSSPGRGK